MTTNMARHRILTPWGKLLFEGYSRAFGPIAGLLPIAFASLSACSAAPLPERAATPQAAALSTFSDADLARAQTDNAASREQFAQQQKNARARCYQRFAVVDCLHHLREQHRAESDAQFQQYAALREEAQRRRAQAQWMLIAARKAQLAQDEEESREIMAQQQTMAAQEASLREQKTHAAAAAAAQRASKAQSRAHRNAAAVTQKLAESEQQLRARQRPAPPTQPRLPPAPTPSPVQPRTFTTPANP